MTLPKLETLKTLAERACLCRMAGREAPALDNEYRRLTAGLMHEGFASASAPVSYGIDCFRELGENACVLTEGILDSSEKDFVCTTSQGEELERVFSSASPPVGGDLSGAYAAALRRLEAMREEVKQNLTPPLCEQV